MAEMMLSFENLGPLPSSFFAELNIYHALQINLLLLFTSAYIVERDFPNLANKPFRKIFQLFAWKLESLKLSTMSCSKFVDCCS